MYYIVGICIAHQLYYVVISPKSECSLTGRVDGRSGGESPTVCVYVLVLCTILTILGIFLGLFQRCGVGAQWTGVVSDAALTTSVLEVYPFMLQGRLKMV